jgi:hypothetical protein
MKLGTEGIFLNIIKAIYDKYISNIILYAENQKPFPLKSGMRHRCPLSPLLLQIILEFLTRALRQEKEIQGIQIGEEEVKLSLLGDDMTLYQRDSKNPTKKLLELINTFSKVAGYKINTQKSKAFLYTNNELSEKEIRNTIPFAIASKNYNT